MRQSRRTAIGLGNVVQESGTDNASGTPQQGDGGKIQFPAILLTGSAHQDVYKRQEFWKNTAKFWMKLFGINFAVGVATGLILEFEFGTNWSNYSWFVGDIFGAPLAIEGILAFFMEATFIAVMFFGWNKVSKRFHLASTWLTGLGATISAWWILVANALSLIHI